jgi:hypothetical protein
MSRWKECVDNEQDFVDTWQMQISLLL